MQSKLCAHSHSTYIHTHTHSLLSVVGKITDIIALKLTIRKWQNIGRIKTMFIRFDLIGLKRWNHNILIHYHRRTHSTHIQTAYLILHKTCWMVWVRMRERERWSKQKPAHNWYELWSLSHLRLLYIDLEAHAFVYNRMKWSFAVE